jgi:hypothetical protein
MLVLLDGTQQAEDSVGVWANQLGRELSLGLKQVDSQHPDLFPFHLQLGLPVWGEGLLYSLGEVDVLGLEWQVREGWVPMVMECF